MNREILFRGKNLKDNEWTEGYYCRYGHIGKEKDYIIPDYASALYGVGVDSNTVGQFTGLTDKNNTKIFEGDIITFEDVCCEGGSGYEYPDEWAVEAMNRAKIIIRNGCVCFGKELFETSAYEDIQFYYPNLNEWFAECAEVIGNIYDDPELIATVEKRENE